MEGLSSGEVRERITAGQVNKTNNNYTKSYGKIVCENIFTFFNVISIILFVLILKTGAYLNTLFIGVVISNAATSIFHECKAKKTIDSLNMMNSPKAEVMRDGKRQTVNAEEIVLDDIVFIKSGTQICADLEIISTDGLEIDESIITGESRSIDKNIGDTVYSGSFVISGTAAAKACAVGKNSYISRITSIAKKDKRVKSEINNFVNSLIKKLIYAMLPLGVLLFITQTRGGVDVNTAISGVGGAITGMIPSGLVLICTISMAMGVYKSSPKGVLIREAAATETLARTDTICIDKTGTITTGRLITEKIEPESPEFDKAKLARLINAFEDKNATAAAILEASGSGESEKPIGKISFSSERKYMAAQFADGTYILGAPEIVCGKEYESGGKRTLVFAVTNEEIKEKTLPGNVNVLCNIVLEDEVKEDAGKVISEFKDNGVSVKIISGDNPKSALRAAQRAGINVNKCCDLSAMTESEVKKAAEEYEIFGRAKPKHKQIIVRELQKNGKTVAMIGDGVNDIPAMREADLSIAMASGNDAVKGCGKILLLKSSFSPLVSVVREGRSLINNMERVSGLYLVKTIYSLLITVFFIFLNMQYPFEPIHLSIIGSLTVGTPSFFMAMENNYSKIRKGFAKRIISNAAPGGLIISANAILMGVLNKFGIITHDASVISTVYIAGFIAVLTLAFVSLPMSRYRRIIVILSGICTIGAFVIFGPIIGLRINRAADFGLFAVLAVFYSFIMLILNKYIEKRRNL